MANYLVLMFLFSEKIVDCHFSPKFKLENKPRIVGKYIYAIYWLDAENSK